MSSSTEIVNFALIKVGGERITDLNDVNSTEAVKANAIYNKVRKGLLRSHFWGFALKKASLNELSEEPELEFGHAFELPIDLIRIRKVICPSSLWERVGNQIHTDDTSIDLVYIADITDTTLFDPLFEEVLVLKLAYELAYSVSSNQSLKQELLQEYTLKIREAKAISSQEHYPKNFMDGSWINSRWF